VKVPLPEQGRFPWPSPCADGLGSLSDPPAGGPLNDGGLSPSKRGPTLITSGYDAGIEHAAPGTGDIAAIPMPFHADEKGTGLRCERYGPEEACASWTVIPLG
jgi:hypothetical protein